MNQLSRLWQGELALREAFWNWAVFGGLLVNLASTALFLILITADWQISAFVTGYLFSVLYNVIASVGVWRSATHYAGERHWADLARIVTITGMILLSIT